MSASARHRARSLALAEGGFTLIELLVSLAVLGLLSVLLFNGLRFGAQAWNKSYAHTQSTDDVRTAQQLLRRAIENAYPYFLVSDPTHSHVDFSGTVDRIELLAPPPASIAAGGLARYVFSVTNHGGKADLSVTVAPELATDATSLGRELLLPNLKSMSFEYLGTGSESGWQRQWQDRKELPRLIGIEAAFFADDDRLWPELLIAPKIDMDVSCVFDPLTHYCRGRSR